MGGGERIGSTRRTSETVRVQVRVRILLLLLLPPLSECISGRISLLALVWLMPLLVGQALEGAAQGWHLYSIPGQFMSKRCAIM